MHRRIRHLRLRSARAEHARHGRVLLEDALRTATLSDEARLIVVRRLDLGRISARASATQWSRQLEQTFRETPLAPVRFDAPTAARAEAVYFQNSTEPWLILAERAATHRPLPEWFWPVAAPGWQPALSATDTLRLVIRELARAGGLRLTLELAARLRTGHALPRLLQGLRAEDLALLTPELVASPIAPPSPPRTSARTPVTSPPLPPLELVFVQSWGPHDLRTRWLAACHAARTSASSSWVSIVPLNPAQIDAIVTAWLPPAPSPARETPAPPQPTNALATSPPSPPASATTTPVVAEPRQNRPTQLTPERQFTRAAGLFFTLPLFARAGLPAHLASLPPADAALLPWQILRLALQHARVADDDPCVATLRDLPPSHHPLGRWLLAAHRHALRLAQLNLRTLIARPALIRLSPTHVDVFFRPGDAEVRLRRAALDLDPGWVPWLGRVITFHFNRAD